MIRTSLSALSRSRSTLSEKPNYLRQNQRRAKIESRRIAEAQWMPKAIEPTQDQARELYRKMLKEGYRTLVITDKEYFRAKMRYEFEITARQTSSRVRGLMFEKGHWMLKNKMGGLV